MSGGIRKLGRGVAAAAVLGVAVAPVIIKAPRRARAGAGEPGSPAEVVRACRASGLSGRALVDHAQQLVNRRFTTYSILNLWETPGSAFRNGRGYSNQYNLVLAEVLEALGFSVQRVRASRVRKDQSPWWRTGHSWLRVVVDGKPLDVCAGAATNRAGEVDFYPVSEVHRFNAFTYLNSNNGMIPFAVFEAWRSLVTGRPLPRWVQRPFTERVREGD